jgi:hypothetical protein
VVRFLPFLISLVLTVYALFSCIQTPDEDVPHLPKLLWIVLIVFVPFAGPIVWLLMSRAYVNRQETVVRREPSKPPARPTAPDDDPDFLKSLDRYRDPRTTARPPEPEGPKDEPKPPKPPKPPKKPKDAKGSEDSPSETDDGKA